MCRTQVNIPLIFHSVHSLIAPVLGNENGMCIYNLKKIKKIKITSILNAWNKNVFYV